MPYCCVVTCKNHSGKTNKANSGISYFRFPTSLDIRQKWIEATGRKETDWSPQRTSSICSKHFDEDVIYLSGNQRRIPDDVVPTLQLPGTENSSDIEKSDSDEDGPLENIRIENSNKTLRSSLDRASKMIEKQKRLIKILRERNRRACKKIAIQNKIINDLMEIYGLGNNDIAVLRAEIINSNELEELDTTENTSSP